MPRPFPPQALTALLLILAACATAPTLTPTPAPTALTGTAWTLETLHGSPLIDGTTITLEFDERPGNHLGGSSGCNLYGGRYRATDTAFRVVDGVETTAMACDTPSMEQEQVYTETLMDVSSYRLTAGHLDLANEEGDTVLVFGAQE